ncbi:hypothetical protein MMC17_000909 [Xylographa soralifera]|nr:hypothetical protein [Xylographa soralifera]
MPIPETATGGYEALGNERGQHHATRQLSRTWSYDRRDSAMLAILEERGDVTADCVGGNGENDGEGPGLADSEKQSKSRSFQARTGSTAGMHVKRPNETFLASGKASLVR